jgi:formylglycine-generating enzyme required for sulfatase activity
LDLNFYSLFSLLISAIIAIHKWQRCNTATISQEASELTAYKCSFERNLVSREAIAEVALEMVFIPSGTFLMGVKREAGDRLPDSHLWSFAQ